MSILKTYWRYSRTPFYSIIFALPLLLVYEVMVFTFNHSDIIGLRNGADVLVRQALSLFNIYGFYVVGLVVLGAILVAYYFLTRSGKKVKWEGQFFFLMTLESILYAFVLFFVVEYAGRYLLAMGISASSRRMGISLALGAGIYEEFVFRFILVTGFVFFLKDIIKLNKLLAYLLAVLAASVIFALFHYLGPYGEVFEWKTGIVRFGAGLFLAILYLLRGYGITAYTHTFYDLIVLFW